MEEHCTNTGQLKFHLSLSLQRKIISSSALIAYIFWRQFLLKATWSVTWNKGTEQASSQVRQEDLRPSFHFQGHRMLTHPKEKILKLKHIPEISGWLETSRENGCTDHEILMFQTLIFLQGWRLCCCVYEFPCISLLKALEGWYHRLILASKRHWVTNTCDGAHRGRHK